MIGLSDKAAPGRRDWSLIGVVDGLGILAAGASVTFLSPEWQGIGLVFSLLPGIALTTFTVATAVVMGPGGRPDAMTAETVAKLGEVMVRQAERDVSAEIEALTKRPAKVG